MFNAEARVQVLPVTPAQACEVIDDARVEPQRGVALNGARAHGVADAPRNAAPAHARSAADRVPAALGTALAHHLRGPLALRRTLDGLRRRAMVALLCALAPLAHAAPAWTALHHVAAPGVSGTPLRVRTWHARGDCTRAQPCPVLYLNDGQDAEAIALTDTLLRMRTARQIGPLLVVAIDMPPDRMGAYGLADGPLDSAYGPIGARAPAYADWQVRTLVPWVDARYPTVRDAQARTLLGWSLGALQAFDAAWRAPRVFGRVGLFSPSFWVASDRTDVASRQRTRAVHARIAREDAPPLAMFMGVGTDEETDDRDGDGVNDALDDVRESIEGWTDGTAAVAGLRQRGYTVRDGATSTARTREVALRVLPGGRHDTPSWGRLLPAFLRWGYGRNAAPAATRP